MYTLTLNDGTSIGNLAFKHSCLVSKELLTAAMFRGKLSPVKVEGTSGPDEDPKEYDYNGLIGEHEHMEVVYIREQDGGYALMLRDIPRDEYERALMASQIEYVAMMADIEL